jgi:predicted metal-binding protein
MTTFVRITCKGHGESPTPEQPRSGLRPSAAPRANEALGGEIAVVPVACLAHGARVRRLAPSGAGKWSDLVGALDQNRDAADVVVFARPHDADAAGAPPCRQRPAHVRNARFARVPPPPRLPPQPETAAG